MYIKVYRRVNFFPNPFTEKIEIKGDIEKVQEIVLYDAKMQLVKKLDISSGNINLSNLKPGVYMAWATWFNGATSSYKLVKL